MRWIRRQLRHSRLLPGLALLAVAGKLLVPPGFMPDRIDAGGWLMVCPEGLPAGLLDHHHGDDDRDSGAGTGTGVQDCSTGSATASPGLLSAAPQIAPVVFSQPFFPAPARSTPRRRGASAQARAPPRLFTA